MKLSDEKITYPGRKQVYRQRDERGKFKRDIICRADEELEGEKLLVDVMRNGELCYDLPPIDRIKEKAMRNLSDLPEEYKRLIDPEEYPVLRSKRLEEFKKETEERILKTEIVEHE